MILQHRKKQSDKRSFFVAVFQIGASASRFNRERDTTSTLQQLQPCSLLPAPCSLIPDP
jgi:hypothetical protein